MKISREIKTGLLLVVALGLLIFGFNFLKGKDIFNTTDIFYAVYPQVSGVVESNPVLIHGFRIGRVKKIELLEGTEKLLVTMSISDRNAKIPKGTVAKIISSDLLGAKAIELDLGKGADFIQDGDTLQSGIEASLQESVNATVKPLKEKTEKLISSIDSIMEVVQSILDKTTRDNLNKSFGNIKHTLETFDKTAMRLDTLMASERQRISNIFAKVESITMMLASNNEKISVAIKNFSSLSDTLVKANIAQTIGSANAALVSVSEIMEKINKGQGSAGMLVNDDKLYKNLSSASLSLDNLLKDMEDNPWRYVSLRGKKYRTKKMAPQIQ